MPTPNKPEDIIDRRPTITVPGVTVNYSMAEQKVLEALRDAPTLYEYGGNVAMPAIVNGTHRTLIVNEYSLASALESRMCFVKPVAGMAIPTVPMPITFAKFLIHSPRFLAALPHVRLWSEIQLPYLGLGQDFLSFTLPGYNPDPAVFMPASALVPMELETEEAHAALNLFVADFPFLTAGDLANYIAFAITFYCRLLFSGPSPWFMFLANTPRAGKDAAVLLVHITGAGRTAEVSWMQEESDNAKMILAAAMAGEPFMHLSNLVGRFRSPLLERTFTQRGITGRILGISKMFTGTFEPVWSGSANSDFSPGGDLNSRILPVRMFCDAAHPNARAFTRPDLLAWAYANRLINLGWIRRIVLNWFDAGQPAPRGSYASFPTWFRVVGGIVQHALGQGLNIESASLQADPRVADLAYLLALIHDPAHPDREDFPKDTPWPDHFNFLASQLRPVVILLQKSNPEFLEDFPLTAVEFNQLASAQKRFGRFVNARAGVPTGNFLLTLKNPDVARTEQRRFAVQPIRPTVGLPFGG